MPGHETEQDDQNDAQREVLAGEEEDRQEAAGRVAGADREGAQAEPDAAAEDREQAGLREHQAEDRAGPRSRRS